MPAPLPSPRKPSRLAPLKIAALALLLALWSTWPIGFGAIGLGPVRLPHDPAYGDEQRAPVHGTLALLEVQRQAPWIGPQAWRSDLSGAPFGQDLLWRDHQYLPARLLAPLVQRFGAERAFGIGLLLAAFAAALGALCLARRLCLAPAAGLFLALACLATPAALRGGLTSLARGPDPWLPWILFCGLAGPGSPWRPWLQGMLLAGACLSGWGLGLVAGLGVLAVNLWPVPRQGPFGPLAQRPRPLCLMGALLLASVLGWPFLGAVSQQRLEDPTALPARALGSAPGLAGIAGNAQGRAPEPGGTSGPAADFNPPGMAWLARLQAPELSPLRRARGQGFEPFEPAPGRPPPGAPQWSWVLLLTGALGLVARRLARWAAVALGLSTTALFALWLAARSRCGLSSGFDPLDPWPALECLLRAAPAPAGSALAALGGGALDQACLCLAAVAGAAAVDAGLRAGPQARLLAWSAPLLLALELWAQPLPSFQPLPLPPVAPSQAPPGAVLHLPVEPRTRPIDVALARAGQAQTLPLFLDAAAPELLRFGRSAPALLSWIGSGRLAAPELVALELDLLEVGQLWLDLEAARAPWTASFAEAADLLPGWVREPDRDGFARWRRARAFFDPALRTAAER